MGYKMIVSTQLLKKRALDYAVAIARGKYTEDLCYLMTLYDTEHNYSSSWDKSGPIVEETRASITYLDNTWRSGASTGCSALEALLREYVRLHSGDSVDIPEEILDVDR
jgi:hypothetical protein